MVENVLSVSIPLKSQTLERKKGVNIQSVLFCRCQAGLSLLTPYLLSHNLPRGFLSELIQTTYRDEDSFKKVNMGCINHSFWASMPSWLFHHTFQTGSLSVTAWWLHFMVLFILFFFPSEGPLCSVNSYGCDQIIPSMASD